MRRKSTRSGSKSTPETKSESRKSSRSSRKRETASKSQDSEDENTNTNATILNKNENTKESIEDQEISEKTVVTVALENENKFDTNNDTSNTTEGGHTPPPIRSTGNEEPDCDDGDAEKGKSKGINNSQVEENSEIKMNSVTTGSAGEASTKIDVNVPIVDNLVIEDQKITDKCSDVELINVGTDSVKCNEENKGSVDNCEGQTETDKCSSANGGIENETVESEKSNGESQIENENRTNDADDDQAEEGEIRESKSDEENENYSRGGHLLKAKKPAVKIKLRRDSFFEALEKLRESDEVPSVKKFKWDPTEHHCLKLSYSDLYKLQLDDFKSLSADLKLADEKDVRLEEIYKPKLREFPPVKERTKSIETSSEETEKPTYNKQSSNVSSDDQENTNIIALNRKISIVDDTASKLKPPPSPAKQPVSSILYISNLVRPFTIKQLRELLERTGTIMEDGFWTDRIKSKCYVQYDSAEDAEATRNALHGVNWPIGNGKKLVIEFATEEEMEKARNPPVQPVAPPPRPPTPPRAKTPPKKIVDPPREARNGDRREERKRKDSERERDRVRRPPLKEREVRETHRARTRSRERSRERRRKHSGRRSLTPLEDYIARKQRKLEESVPQKLMDDLFQRTKTMPCLYWQPLSPEEISIKQQQRLSRMEEHKRRLQENSRNRGGGIREPGRGGYRRRFD